MTDRALPRFEGFAEASGSEIVMDVIGLDHLHLAVSDLVARRSTTA